MRNIVISTAYITLGQLLKEAGVIQTGGMAKWYLDEHDILVNDEIERRRGKKLIPGDIVTVSDGTTYQVASK